ncbi:MAG: hypothetical protein IPN85_07915 [Flavobacteriales bacterium]|nr:hypothetical protein [Flavobacteriales bacterium]MBK9287977.1 hypothetical protein [Flavobacteriales bacterium]MBL0037009.1 hypothetical protein [Flavobacteriales bacterium]
MIVPSDPDYQATKRIKQGLDQMGVPEIELADTLQREFGVRPLNILYEWVATAGRARLRVVFERYSEAAGFWSSPLQIDGAKEARIWKAFHASAIAGSPIGPSSDRTASTPFLIITAFEPIAKAECNHRIPQAQIDALRVRFAEHGVWKFDRFGSTVTCFFHTGEQLLRSATDGSRAVIAAAYAGLITAHDEFGYCMAPIEQVLFDSKANLDTNFEGNLYYYHL